MDNEKLMPMNTESAMLWCPRALRETKDLNSTEKWILIDILNLTSVKGYCYATNEYLAIYNEVEKRTIERTLRKLEELKYIKVEGKGRKRKIFSIKFVIFATNLSQDCDKNVADIDSITNNIYLSNLNIKRDNSSHAREGERCVSQKEKPCKVKKKPGAYSEYTPEQLEFHKAFPERIADDIQVPAYVDIHLLIDSINKSEWLRERHNMSLRSCVNRYRQIINGFYNKVGDEIYFYDGPCDKADNILQDEFGGER